MLGRLSAWGRECCSAAARAPPLLHMFLRICVSVGGWGRGHTQASESRRDHMLVEKEAGVGVGNTNN